MPLTIVRNDITKMETDAIVNAANNALQMGGGVCGAIFNAAGVKKLQKECNAIGYCETGQAVITKGFDLPAKHIIHTVGPVWKGGTNNEPELLHDCYINSLDLAFKYKCESIAFPLISSGIYGYPKDKALEIANDAVSEFLLNNEMTVYIVVYDKTSFEMSSNLYDSIKQYIDDVYFEEHYLKRQIKHIEISKMESQSLGDEAISFEELPLMSSSFAGEALTDILEKLDETFSEMLLRLIDEKGMTDPQAYKKANINRKHFSKIRNNKDYSPSKATALAFAIALELNLDETLNLLEKAGYTLSHSSKFDIIIEYFIKRKQYNIFEINEALFAFDQSLLG